jgi:hypothetical protein
MGGKREQDLFPKKGSSKNGKEMQSLKTLRNSTKVPNPGNPCWEGGERRCLCAVWN